MRRDQVLIPLSTILKFTAPVWYLVHVLPAKVLISGSEENNLCIFSLQKHWTDYTIILFLFSRAVPLIRTVHKKEVSTQFYFYDRILKRQKHTRCPKTYKVSKNIQGVQKHTRCPKTYRVSKKRYFRHRSMVQFFNNAKL